MNLALGSSLAHEGTDMTFASARPRVGYDARFSLGEYRGMGRYLRRLIGPIAPQALGFCATGETDPTLNLSQRGFGFYPLWEQFSLPRRVASSRVEFLLAPYNTAPLNLPRGTRLILVLHDFIYLRSSAELPFSQSAYQNFGRLYRRVVVPRAVRHAERIICVSQHTREELLDRFKVAEEKVLVIPNTIDESWFKSSHPSTLGGYILCVSGEAPNKNLDRALEGYAAYCRSAAGQALELRVAGVKPRYHASFSQIAAQLGVQSRVQFLEYVSEERLQSLYVNANAFFFPSRDEGFGIPVLEALATGVPVIASNSSSIPEVAGDAALYFHPDSTEEMGKQLCMLHVNPEMQELLSTRGRERALTFHPRVIDDAIRKFWDELLVAQ
jgi:glycosyltransferase involved in cell wall biosynthesis